MNTSGRRFKDAIYEQFARIGKAIAAPKRLELLDLLSQGPRTVEALAAEAGASVANTSQHLQVLRAARLVLPEKQGVRVEYRLASDEVSRFFVTMRALAESRLAEVELVTRQFFEQRGLMEAVEVDELLRRVRSGEVTVLDVRPVAEYLAGHVPGAISIPLSELQSRLTQLPKGREIIAYCRGPYCVMALEAVDLLRVNGFKAHRITQGVVEWRARGWPIESDHEEARG